MHIGAIPLHIGQFRHPAPSTIQHPVLLPPVGAEYRTAQGFKAFREIRVSDNRYTATTRMDIGFDRPRDRYTTTTDRYSWRRKNSKFNSQDWPRCCSSVELRFWSNSSFMRRHHGRQPAFPVGRIRQAGEDIFFRQFGIVGDNFLVRHPRGQPAEHIADGDAHAANARFSAPLAPLDRDDLLVVHAKLYANPKCGANCNWRSSSATAPK